MIAIAYHADLKEVQRNVALANALSQCANGAIGPFDRMAWWVGLERHCGMAPLLAVAQDGEEIAALPLAHDRSALIGLANWYTFRLRPLISAGGAHLLPTLAANLRRRAGAVILSHLPEEDGIALQVADAFARAGWVVELSPCDINHHLIVGGRSYADYLATRPGPVRTTLKRKAKKVRCQIHRDWSEEVWAAYEAIYAASWKGEEGSMPFLKQFAREEADAGRLRLGLAWDGDTAVAAQMWTVEGGTAYIHKLAYREEAKPLSPGTSLSAALFEEVIDHDRVEAIDFGTGDDPYKRDWMEAVRLRYRMEARDPRRMGQWRAIARIILRRIKHRLRPPPPLVGGKRAS